MKQVTHCEFGAVIETSAFRSALISWNIAMTDGGFAVDMAVRCADTGEWSRELEINAWGDMSGTTRSPKAHPWCAVAVDHFQSQVPCNALRLHQRSSSNTEAVVHQLVACTRDDAAPGPMTAASQCCRIEVPFRSQKSEDATVADRICSPTSVAMVMEYFGVDVPTKDVAALLHDPEERIYGNWVRAVQGAHELGLAGHLESFEDLESAEALLARGQPIIASIRTAAGDIPNAPYEQTQGHLLVLTGTDERGNIRVNDPAAVNAASGVTTYPRQAIHKAWILNGGIAYILHP